MIACPVCKGKDAACVACQGKGKIPPPAGKQPNRDTDGRKKAAAHILQDKGYTLREIAEILGYPHPQSIKHLLDKPQ